MKRALTILLASTLTSVAADTAAEKRVRVVYAAQEKEGFKIRDDFWTGSLKPGAKKNVKHQLYRGNEYWFWLGTAEVGDKAYLRVYDSKGRPVDVQTMSGKGWTAVRVLPPKTESYHVVFTLKQGDNGKKEAIAWAMTYGYR